MHKNKEYKKKIIKLISNKKATIGIIGLGYVGLPLAISDSQRNTIHFYTRESPVKILFG